MQPTRNRLAAVLGAAILATAFSTTAVAADPVPSATSLSVADEPLQEHHAVVLFAAIAAASDDWGVATTIDFDEVDGLGGECQDVPVDPVSATVCAISGLAPGTYHYQATYSGNATVAGSVSNVLELVVAPDTVDATSVVSSAGTIYPVKDGYRDTVRFSGNRQEPISVAIRFYDPKGRKIRTVTLPSATGGYAYDWNGKSAGKILPAGSYRIVQTLVDGAGTTKSFTTHVKLSHKKLVRITRTITKMGSAIDARAGNVAKSGPTLRLHAGNLSAIAGWQFKVAKAVRYDKLSFRVYASAGPSAPPAVMAIQNFSLCSTWDVSCFDRAKAIGNGGASRRWYATSGSPNPHRHGRTVRGLVGTAAGTVYVYKAEVTVTCWVLR